MIDDRRARVLIADDDPGIRRMLAVTLKKDGYQTADACDGREALDAMRAGQTDLVLLDLMMPKVTGWQVLAERAVAPELRKIPIIVITAERGAGVANIPNDGLCALLLKPFDLQTLHALVKSYLLRAEAGAQRLPTQAPGNASQGVPLVESPDDEAPGPSKRAEQFERRPCLPANPSDPSPSAPVHAPAPGVFVRSR